MKNENVTEKNKENEEKKEWEAPDIFRLDVNNDTNGKINPALGESGTSYAPS